MPTHYLLFAPDRPDSAPGRVKHQATHNKYCGTIKDSMVFGGVFMSPSNLSTDEHGQPVDSKGTTLIYEAETLEEAEALVHGDPFWASDEVWDRQQTRIVPLSVMLNKLASR